MKLTKTTDFACRIMMCLAEKREKLTLRTLSKECDIPYNQVAKLVQKLCQGELIQTIQGKYGGVILNKAPKHISLKHMINSIEGPPHYALCEKNSHNHYIDCQLKPRCKLKGVLRTLETTISTFLEGITLDKVIS